MCHKWFQWFHATDWELTDGDCLEILAEHEGPWSCPRGTKAGTSLRSFLHVPSWLSRNVVLREKVQPKGPGEFSIVPSRGPSSTERMQDNRQSRIPVKWTSSIGFVAICLLSWCFGTHSEAYLKPFEFWVPLLVQQRPDQFYIRSIF